VVVVGNLCGVLEVLPTSATIMLSCYVHSDLSHRGAWVHTKLRAGLGSEQHDTGHQCIALHLSQIRSCRVFHLVMERKTEVQQITDNSASQPKQAEWNPLFRMAFFGNEGPFYADDGNPSWLADIFEALVLSQCHLHEGGKK
jgi:hypothetical protein